MPSKPHVKSTAAVLLNKKFWRDFTKNHWEKKPLLLKNVQSSLREVSAEEIFNLLVLYGDRCRKLNNPEGFKFFIDGFKASEEDVLQVLPEKEDKSILGYHDRMSALFPDYCLVCDELLRVNYKKQHIITNFTSELYDHVGLPNRFSEIGLYLGNYRKTPFGVHVDNCSVFSFPVVGEKSFRLWTPLFVKQNPGLVRAFKYNKYKNDSQLLKAGPGDMIYWPSSAWHIAESDGSFSATWSLGIWVDKPYQELFNESLTELLNKKGGSFIAGKTTRFKNLHSDVGEVAELPKAYLQAIDLLKNLTLPELQETFLKSWMKHISLQGFKNIPHNEFKISSHSRIQLRNRKSMILWQKGVTSKEKVYLSFGGALVESSISGGLLKLVKALNAGENCLVSAFLKGTNKKKDLYSLQILADAGAF
ncbi:MAG: JmjC domain-containing protein [Pseudobdellovibrionaceae bacterium]